MNFFVPIRPLLKGWLLSFAGFGFLAFVISFQFITAKNAGVDMAARGALRDFLPWAVLTPLLFRLAGRYPLGLKKRPSRAGLHLGACLAVLALCHWWTGMVDPGFRAGPGGPRPGEEHRRSSLGPGRHEGPPEGWRPPPPREGGPPPPPPRHEGPPPPGMGPSPFREARAFAVKHRVDLVHIGTFQLPLYLMLMSAAHASLFYRRDKERATTLAKAQLDVLTKQLQPHFLFNTLNMIAELVHEDPHKADAMITALSEMLRLTLDANANELVPLHQETQFIERYFAIMQMRFGNRVKYECDISPEARAGLVPPFLLQPLVENAIRHGLEPTPAGGTVTIRGDVIKDVLHVSIRDNGIGIAEEKPTREGLGLRNTRERLRQLFGEAASLTLKNDHGTEVEVTLPFTTA